MGRLYVMSSTFHMRVIRLNMLRAGITQVHNLHVHAIRTIWLVVIFIVSQERMKGNLLVTQRARWALLSVAVERRTSMVMSDVVADLHRLDVV